MPDSIRELQRKIPGRDKNVLKDNLLSQDVCVTLLQDNKLAIRRAEMVCDCLLCLVAMAPCIVLSEYSPVLTRPVFS